METLVIIFFLALLADRFIWDPFIKPLFPARSERKTHVQPTHNPATCRACQELAAFKKETG